MNMEIIYRLANEAEIPELFRANIGLSGKIIDEELLPIYVKDGRIFCAETNGQIVSLLYWENNFIGDPGFWFIHQITTTAVWRRKGIASELIRAFLKYASSLGVKKVFADVRGNNARSIGLMKKLNAVECGWLKGLDDDSKDDVWKVFRFNLQ